MLGHPTLAIQDRGPESPNLRGTTVEQGTNVAKVNDAPILHVNADDVGSLSETSSAGCVRRHRGVTGGGQESIWKDGGRMYVIQGFRNASDRTWIWVLIF